MDLPRSRKLIFKRDLNQLQIILEVYYPRRGKSNTYLLGYWETSHSGIGPKIMAYILNKNI